MSTRAGPQSRRFQADNPANPGHAPLREALEWNNQSQISEALNRIDWNGLKKLADELALDIADLAAEAAPGFGRVIRGLAKLAVGKFGHQEQGVELPRIDKINKQCRDLFRKIVPPGKQVFVLVDDLDRCSPPNMVNMLEWFKNHFNNESCVYIIGLDHRMAARAITGHYRDYVRTVGAETADAKAGDPQVALDYGYRYLDKLFELDFEIHPSRGTEGMAMKVLELGGKAANIVEWTRLELGSRGFAGEREMNMLLGLPALWVPRVMIRTLNTYRFALMAIKKEASKQRALLDNDLSQSFPVWLFLIATPHHLIAPDKAEAFVRLFGNPPTPRSGSEEKTTEAVRGAIGHFGSDDTRADLPRTIAKIIHESEPSNGQQAQYLYRLVREKTPRPFREEVRR